MRVKSIRVILASVGVLAAWVAMPAYSAEATDHPTVTCKDGTTSHAGKGACSHHGGVAKGGASASSHEKKDEASGHSEHDKDKGKDKGK